MPYRSGIRLLAAAVVLVVTTAYLPAADRDEAPQLSLQNGDRVALVGATFLERDRHFSWFETVLRTRFPGVELSFRNMAWPGDTTTVQMRPLNFGSLEEHIARQKPTVAFVCYGSNEAFDGPDKLDSFLDGYGRILDILEKTCREIVLVAPIRHENLGPPLPDPAAHNRVLEQYVAQIAGLADERGYPFVDLFHTLIEPSNPPPAYPLTENGIHLSDYGYWRAANRLADELGLPSRSLAVEISARQVDAEVDGGKVSNVEATNRLVRFDAAADQLPSPPPPGAPADVDADIATHTFRVQHLQPGKYVLKIDGSDVATASADEWSGGVRIAASPDFDQARALRRETAWKNLLFFHRWRAHNGEYIYGRRSETSENWSRDRDGGNSGNPTFPKEMADFDRLIAESDLKASKLSQPEKHSYELRRVAE